MDQQTRHSQVQVALKQIQALRQMAREASIVAQPTRDNSEIGFILTSNMLAALALELGLKIFFMSFCKDGPPKVHGLLELFQAMPAQIRGDIDATYATGEKPNLPVRYFAFIRSAALPENPRDVRIKSYHDAASIFAGTSANFIKSRYFFEQVDGFDWSVTDHPIDYMIGMSEALEVVYNAYLERGGWGDLTDQANIE